MKQNDDQLVVFDTYYSDVDAYIAKGVLETNGVPCIINNEIMSSVYPITITSLGEIKLLVFRRDLELARRIMKAHPIKSDEPASGDAVTGDHNA